MSTRTPALRHSIPTAFIFLLIGLFALMSLMLTLLGTRVYRHIADTSAQNGDSQIVLNYIVNKVRTCDAQDAVRVETHNGFATLCLYEALDGDPYVTYIYAYNGYLWEQFSQVPQPFEPEKGERLTPVLSLAFALTPSGLLQTTIETNAGEAKTVLTALRAVSSGEAK